MYAIRSYYVFPCSKEKNNSESIYAMINIQTFVFNPFQQNTYLLYTPTGAAVIIDPGMYSLSENQILDAFVQENRLHIQAVVTTHCHVDHILGCRFAMEHYQAPLFIHSSEVDLLRRVVEHGAVFGLQATTPPAPTGFLDLNLPFSIGEDTLQLLHVPGHSTGSVAYYHEASQFVITGDALFRGSIGRTDFPGGDYQTLIDSIRNNFV